MRYGLKLYVYFRRTPVFDPGYKNGELRIMSVNIPSRYFRNVGITTALIPPSVKSFHAHLNWINQVRYFGVTLHTYVHVPYQ